MTIQHRFNTSFGQRCPSGLRRPVSPLRQSSATLRRKNFSYVTDRNSSAIAQIETQPVAEQNRYFQNQPPFHRYCPERCRLGASLHHDREGRATPLTLAPWMLVPDHHICC